MVEHTEPGSPAPRLGLSLRRRDLVGLAGLLIVLAIALELAFGGAGTTKAPAGATGHAARYEGLAVSPTQPARPLVLDNYLGTPVNIASYRGKAVLVTFLYTHCPDVCPLIASHLHTAEAEMPVAERRRLQIIAVSVDPRGDTRSTVAQFLTAHEMTGQMQYLIGSAPALEAVWKRWGIADAAQGTAANPNLVAHSALIYGITAHARIAVIFPANFTPGEIVHDARTLAAS